MSALGVRNQSRAGCWNLKALPGPDRAPIDIVNPRFFPTQPSWLLPLLLIVSWVSLADSHVEPNTSPHVEGADSQALEHFENHVRPILANHCFECHGPRTQWSDLRLDSREAILRGGERGPAAIPGDVKGSLILTAVRGEGELVMPPEEKLTDEQKAHLAAWIAAGAPWPASDAPSTSNQPHWAFQPIQRAEPPAVEDSDWNANPIDQWIRAKLNDHDLVPSEEADRRTLLRRVTLGLTGLPLTEEDLARFLTPQDPNAYEREVDRLLASPRYGEHWARAWLDVARFADTKGYVYGREERQWVHAWPYRDWVIRALNADLPYDTFLLHQIAADLVTEDRSEWAALGFLTLGRRFIGVSRDIIDDRIDVVTRGTMGLTVACARCHDHKYDPIPTADYYALSGVFQSCYEDLVRIDPEPAAEAFEAELAKRIAALEEVRTRRRHEVSDRIRARVADCLMAQRELEKHPEEGFDVIIADSDIPAAFVRRWRDFLFVRAQENDPIFEAWRRFVAIDPDVFSAKAEEVSSSLRGSSADEVHPDVAERFIDPPTSIREVADRYGQLFAEIDRRWKEDVRLAQEQGRAPPTGWEDPEREALRQVLYGSAAPCEVPDEPVVNIEWYFSTGVCNELWKAQGEVDRWLIGSPQAPAHALILRDRTIAVTPRILRRGNPRQLGDSVPRRFLTQFSEPDAAPFSEGSGRLELARAIIDPANPLTARVIVNRIWARHFGTGLVRTTSDFGLRSEPPSHPELLDWLASAFMEHGWSLKWLHRTIVTSRTYRQSSSGPAAAEQFVHARSLDPEVRLRWRHLPHRLTFEELYDATLLATGEWRPDQSGGPATDLFANPPAGRRAIFGRVDRQFLDPALRTFDFANPDLHIPQRSETTVPQQALFFLNNPFFVERARRVAATTETISSGDRLGGLYRRVLGRDPSREERDWSLEFLEKANEALLARENEGRASKTAAAWSYGYGTLDEREGRVTRFEPLPHFTGSAWQGGPAWPDSSLGWVQLTAEGGHAGNDRDHAAIRRWTAPADLVVDLDMTLMHEFAEGDGVRGFIVSSRSGMMGSLLVHRSTAGWKARAVRLETGETLDFVLDLGTELNHDEFLWRIQITPSAQDPAATPVGGSEAGSATEADHAEGSGWDSQRDFVGAAPVYLDPWEQLAQVLLASNEFLFVD